MILAPELFSLLGYVAGLVAATTLAIVGKLPAETAATIIGAAIPLAWQRTRPMLPFDASSSSSSRSTGEGKAP